MRAKAAATGSRHPRVRQTAAEFATELAGSGATTGGPNAGDPGSSAVDAAADTDLVDLAAHVGQPVKVAGLIAVGFLLATQWR